MSFLSNVEVRYLLYHRPVSGGVVSRCPGAHYALRMRREQRWRGKEACHVCTSALAAELIDQLEDRGGLGQSLRSVFVCSCWRPIPLWLGRTINAAFSLESAQITSVSLLSSVAKCVRTFCCFSKNVKVCVSHRCLLSFTHLHVWSYMYYLHVWFSFEATVFEGAVVP